MEEIIIYTTNCPKCRILEAKLKQKNIEHHEITDIDIMNEKGFMSVPILEVDGVVMNFIQANTWINERVVQ
jgi:glutaredoxin